MARYRSSMLIVVAFVLVGTNAFAQAKQPLTHELMWSFQRVGAPVPSPDGKWVVFSVNEVNYDPTKDVSDLWIVAGGRRLGAAAADVEQGRRERAGVERRQHETRLRGETRRRRGGADLCARRGGWRGGAADHQRAHGGECAEVESGWKTDRIPGGDVARRDGRRLQSQGGAGARRTPSRRYDV